MVTVSDDEDRLFGTAGAWPVCDAQLAGGTSPPVRQISVYYPLGARAPNGAVLEQPRQGGRIGAPGSIAHLAKK
jgi:hypothetical protein